MSGSGSETEAEETLEVTWFVLYAKEDQSHSLVPGNDVICDEDVSVGDVVPFVYGSRKRAIEGTVKAMGPDFVKLSKLMKDLNKKSPKRSASFHADKPRSAKVKCFRAIASSVDPKEGSSRQSRQSKKTMSEVFKKGLFAGEDSAGKNLKKETTSKSNILGHVLTDECLNTLSDDGGVTDLDDSASSSSGADLAEADKKAANKSATINKNKHLKLISKYTLGQSFLSKNKVNMSDKDAESNGQSSSENTGEDKVENGKNSTKEEIGETKEVSKENEVVEDDKLEKSETYDDNETEKQAGAADGNESEKKQAGAPDGKESEKKEPSKRSRPRKKRYNKLEYAGDFFKLGPDSPNAHQLTPAYRVYVDGNKLREIKRESKTLLTIARRLTPEVFTEQAIMECSVSGRPSSARQGVPSVLRPALHPDGVNAIYEYCKSKTKPGDKAPTFTSVKKSIGDVLNERRYSERLARELDED